MTFVRTFPIFLIVAPLWAAPAAQAVLPLAPRAAASSAAASSPTPLDTESTTPPGDTPPMPGMTMDHAMSAMPGMAMADDDAMPMEMPMNGALGPYTMSREGSGTSWQPDASPMTGTHWMAGGWSLMAHGFVNAIADRQSGPRGSEQAFVQSMAMLMGNRSIGPGTVGLRAMVSLDPTIGKSGYPLLFQTGETADGRTPLVDRQHPHDLLMELSTSYSQPLGDDAAVFGYVGLPGEPALGPTAFMHRASGMRNPEAPLTHHWLDSTHITFGVATLGASKGPLQIEASWFNGREPDQSRWNIETRAFDSWSTRLSYNPVPSLSMQVSHGDLKSPEQLEPDTRVQRTTASISHHLHRDADEWATTIAYGRNRKSGPDAHVSEPGWLIESTYVLRDTHTFFARAEQVDNSELFAEGQPLHGEAFRIRKLTVGYIVDVARTGPVKWGIGGLVGLLDAPSALDTAYGRSPRSTMLFLQGRL